MTIGIIINKAWNIYNFRSSIIRHFINEGHDVVAIAPRDEYVERLEAMGCRFRDLPMSGSGVNPFSDLLLLWRIRRIIKDEKLDVLLTYTIKPNVYGSIAGRLLNTPVICNISGLGTTFVWNNLVSKIAIFLYNVSVRKASHVFFQNPEDMELFLSKVPVPENNVGLLNGSGIDLKSFSAAPKLPGKAPVFLMIGRLIIEKGAYEYAEAAQIIKQEFPATQFWMLGKWDQLDKRSVKQEDLDHWQEKGFIHYKGTTDDVKTMIVEADVVVLPSYREGAPRTLIEAGAMSRPLIATDVPGCRHVVSDGFNGYLCEVKSGKQLADAIRKYLVLENQEKLQLAKNSRIYMESNYDEKKVIIAYQEVISSIVVK
ncbi:MAG: glycosyltransferase family 4 protein [Cytophagales bacterium]|nr:glycosyltransferase family 4 protein [Cytophagales bacterium]